MVVAGASITVDALWGQSGVGTLFYGCGLALLLSVIAYPEVAEAAWRSSWDGFVHRSVGPAPESLIRLAAWFLLVTVIVVHHYMAFTGAAEQLHR
jgi:hypothetical protein